MIIDIHGHLGNINFAPFWQADGPTLEKYCREAGVDKLCLSSSRSIMYDIHEGNEELHKLLLQSDTFYGYTVVSPTFPDSLKDLDYLKSNPKFRGVKIHPDYHGYALNTPSNYRWVDKVAEKTPMMLFHVSCMPGTGFSPAKTVAAIAKDHPETKFVLAHMAGLFQNGNYPFFPNMDTLEEIMEMGLENIYIDTAHYLMYAYKGVMEKFVKIATADHIVFGTDCPLQGPMQMRFAMEVIRALDIPEEDKEKIFFRNAEKVLGLV